MSNPGFNVRLENFAPLAIKIFLMGVHLSALVVAALLLTGCGNLQISFESPAGGTDPMEGPNHTTPAAQIESPQAPVMTEPGPGPMHLSSLFGSDSGEGKTVLTVEDGVAAFVPSPVEMEILWDYSGPNGKIAYASEFYHPSPAFSRSVTDLWVYDYASASSQQWLADHVGRVYWSPYIPGTDSPQSLVAAVFDSSRGTYDLLLVKGPGETEVLASCASEEFGFSPDGIYVVYKASWFQDQGLRPEECEGVFLVSLEDRTSRRLSDTNPITTGGWFGDQPLWAESLGGLLFKSFNETSILNFVPLDGSGWFPVTNAASIEEEYLPNPLFTFWSDQHRSVIGQTEGMFDPFGIWVYRLTAEGDQIEQAFRINWGDFRRDLILLGWWEPGESVLIRDISNPSSLNPLGEVVVWSLSSRSVVDTISRKPSPPMSLYSAPVTSGFPALDQIVEVLQRGSVTERAELTDLIGAACTQEEFSLGPPPCEPGMPEGTQIERFPYRMYRELRYANRDDLISVMDFDIDGVYSIYAVAEGGFESEWMPAGDYRIVLVERGMQRTIEVVVKMERIVMIEIWELTPPEVFHDFTLDYILPPIE